jgi:hypothetical protein
MGSDAWPPRGQKASVGRNVGMPSVDAWVLNSRQLGALERFPHLNKHVSRPECAPVGKHSVTHATRRASFVGCRYADSAHLGSNAQCAEVCGHQQRRHHQRPAPPGQLTSRAIHRPARPSFRHRFRARGRSASAPRLRPARPASLRALASDSGPRTLPEGAGPPGRRAVAKSPFKLKFRAVPEFTPAAAAARARARAMMAQAGRRGPAGGGRKAKEA